MDSVRENKKALRKSVLEELKKLTTKQKAKESSSLRIQLAKFISANCPKGSIIATFAGLKFEPDLIGLHQLLPDYKLAYPRCGADRSLDFHIIDKPEKELKPGYYRIPEPIDNSYSPIALDQIALFIVPAFAYTKDGLRLGKGGGYYDRILENASVDTDLVGVCFTIQLKETLPVESHDISVNQILIAM